MRRFGTVVWMLGLWPAAVAASDAPPHDAVCSASREVPVPAADAGHAAAGCDAARLYYGADGTGDDPVAARHCAYRERADDRAGPLGGSGVLMMVYANGQGVPQDIALARRFACEFDGAPAEVRARLARLQRIADGHDTAPMDICDDITSGMMAGVCASRDAGFAASCATVTGRRCNQAGHRRNATPGRGCARLRTDTSDMSAATRSTSAARDAVRSPRRLARRWRSS